MMTDGKGEGGVCERQCRRSRASCRGHRGGSGLGSVWDGGCGEGIMAGPGCLVVAGFSQQPRGWGHKERGDMLAWHTPQGAFLHAHAPVAHSLSPWASATTGLCDALPAV